MVLFLSGIEVSVGWVFDRILVFFGFGHNLYVLVLSLQEFLNQSLLMTLLICQVLNGLLQGVESEA